MDETTPLEAALAPTTFDILSFVEQTAYPEKLVTIFRDVSAAKEYAETIKERQALEDHSDDLENDPEIAALTARIEELTAILKKGSLTFSLRGFAPGVVTDIQNKYKEDTDENAADAEIIAYTIQTVTNGEGATDPRKWTADDVKALKRHLAEGEFVKLLVAVADVVFNAAVFDQATDAGFPG